MIIPIDLGSLIIGAIVGALVAVCAMHPQWFDFTGEEETNESH